MSKPPRRTPKRGKDESKSIGPQLKEDGGLAKQKFAAERGLPSEHRPQPVSEELVLGGPRVDHLAVDPAPVPVAFAKGTHVHSELPENLAEASHMSGYKHAGQRVARAARAEYNKKAKETLGRLVLNTDIPQLGDMVLDEQALRKIFMSIDIDRNEVIDGKELRHLFAQLGQSLSDAEIDGMISLCDTRGEGAVSFEDFLAVFGNPAEALRRVDTAALEGVNKQVRSESEDGSRYASEAGSDASSGSSLESRRRSRTQSRTR